MEERSQISNGERSQSSAGERSCDYSNDDDERNFDSGGEHRSCGSHNSRNDETKETLIIKQDRISDMPDGILLHILSFLPTKDAIKSGTLSQRWLYLWTSVSNLRFTCTSLLNRDKFVTIVDQTLLFFLDTRTNPLSLSSTTSESIPNAVNWSRTERQTPDVCTGPTTHTPVSHGLAQRRGFIPNQTLLYHRRCRLNKFIISFEFHESQASSIDTWVRFATSANVEELCLTLLNGFECHWYCVLSQHVYTNSSITTLKLMWCSVEPDGLISWKSLKSLSIGYTNLSEDVIQKVLLGAPLLESLELFGCCGFNRLDIGSASLRKLVVKDYYYYTFWRWEDEGDDSALEISAPNLQSLGILGKGHRKKFRLMNIQSLDACTLNFEQTTRDEDYDNDFEEQRNMVGELIDRLRHVKKLTLGNWCIQILSLLELKGMLSPLSECKCLVLDTHIIKRDIPGIARVLQSSPNLETLVINMSSLYYAECDCECDCENYWTSQKGSSECSLLHVKTVKIFHFDAWCCDYRLAIPLVQFLLVKARVLEKMVINAGRGYRMGCSREKLPLVAQELLSLPRSSPHAVITFSE